MRIEENRKSTLLIGQPIGTRSEISTNHLLNAVLEDSDEKESKLLMLRLDLRRDCSRPRTYLDALDQENVNG